MLDYSWLCKDGEWQCFNTHGSTDPNDWSVVHNQNNCAGTAKAGWCGNKPGTAGTNFHTGQSTSGAFDYVVKHAENGKVNYYGAMVNGDQVGFMQIHPNMYRQFTGQNDVYSGEGWHEFYRPRKRGQSLVNYTRLLGQQRNYSRATVQKAVDLIPELSNALMHLHHLNIPVANENDVYEVMIKFANHYPFMPHKIPEQEYNMLVNHVTGSTQVMTPKNSFAASNGQQAPPNPQGSGSGFDWASMASNVVHTATSGVDPSGMIGGIFDMIISGIQSGIQASDNAELNQWVNAYINYMQTDFGDIKRELSEKGPQAALTWLLRLKDTSWKDLKNYNLNWVNHHGMQVPPTVLQLQQAQADLETQLRQQIAQSPPGTTHVPQTGEYNPNGGTTAPTGNQHSQQTGFDMGKMVMIAGIFIILFLFMR